MDAGVPVPHIRARDPVRLPLCPWHASALELGIATPGTVGIQAPGSFPAWRLRCLLYPQSPVLLASLGVGLVTLLGLAVGSYLVRRSRRPQVTLLDPNEKYLLRLLDKTVSWGRKGQGGGGDQSATGMEGTAPTVVGMSKGRGSARRAW